MNKLTPIALIAISLLVFFFYMRPQYERVKVQQAEAQKYDTLLSQTDELKSIQAELEAKKALFTPSDLDRLSKLVPKKVDTARLLLDVSGVADKYAIQMENIQTTDPVFETGIANEQKPFTSSTFTFNFETSYEAMIAFVRDLERSLRMVDVVDISLTSTAEGSVFFNYSITLQTYWLNPDYQHNFLQASGVPEGEFFEAEFVQ